MSSTTQLVLLPRDGVSAKDGRGWYTSEIGRSHAHPWPPPSTIRGALRAAYGHSLGASRAHPLAQDEWEAATSGVWLSRLVTLLRPLGTPFIASHRMWAAPADAIEGATTYLPLLPTRLSEGVNTLGPEDDDASESLWPLHLDRSVEVSKPKSASGFWTDEQMRRWLRGEPVVRGGGPAELLKRLDYHVAIDSSRLAAEPSLLHASEVTETLVRESGEKNAHEWALGVECALPEAVPGFPRGPIGLGSRRRLAFAEPLEKSDLFAAPPAVAGPIHGLRLILATPAYFQEGWLPDGFERITFEGGAVYVGRLPGVDGDVVLRAAAVPRPQHLSTWDMVKRAPRPTRRLVPAGAVYFFQRCDGQDFTPDVVRALWLAPLGGGREEALGLVLPGVWNPSSEQKGKDS